MNSELIMNSDILDILFEKRNKVYGAYTLRKYYNSRVIKSLSIMMAFVMLVSAFTIFDGKTAKAGDYIVMDAKLAHPHPPLKLPQVKLN